jgi:hypothetical protein
MIDRALIGGNCDRKICQLSPKFVVLNNSPWLLAKKSCPRVATNEVTSAAGL